MKRIHYFISLLALVLGTTAGAQESERLTFGVISDTHFENNLGEGAMVKVPKALKNLTSQGKLDLLVDVGDIVNKGTPSEYKMLNKVFGDASNFTNPVDRLLFVMGGHEYLDSVEDGLNNYQQGLKDFNEGKPYPFNQYIVIKGYPFITVSMSHWYASDTNSPSSGSIVYPVDTQEWLSESLADAADKCPGKPIFVFTHIPPRWTVYGSWPEYETGSAWCMKVLNPILNKYPQVVLFAGHSHYPLGDPRSIHQGANPNSTRQNYYTVINTGSTTYSEVNPTAVDVGIHPENFEYVTEGMILTEQENGDIEIRRYDTYRNEEIGAGQRWILKAPFDGSMFEYADIRDADDNPNGLPLRNGLPAPTFSKSAEISVETDPYHAVASIPQAKDDECVFRYRVRFSREGLVISEKFIFSQFYLNSEMPKMLTYNMSSLQPETDYALEVVAYDSYDNSSEPLIVHFRTPEASSWNPDIKADGQWTFDDPNDLLKSETGRLSIQPITIGKNSVTVVSTLGKAGIKSTAGRTNGDGAIFVPQNSGLKVSRTNGRQTSKNWSIMMDIKMKDAAPYNGLLQTNANNSNDGDLFVYKNKIGMSAMGGYFGDIRNNTWQRIIILNRNGRVHVYVDGQEVLNCESQSRWEIDPWGFYLFCDEDGEMNDTYVTDVSFWEKSLSDMEVQALSGLTPIVDEDPQVTIFTPNIKIVGNDELDFSVTIGTNVYFTFDLPEWIEPIDTMPFAGKHSYTFRAKPLETQEQRSGIITVKGKGLEPQAITIEQFAKDDEEIPEPQGLWAFDNPTGLMRGRGVATLKPAKRSKSGRPETVSTPSVAGIVATQGPSADNGAITVPFDSYLQMAHNQAASIQNTFTILMDIRPKKLDGYNVLFQSNVNNDTDADLFTLGTQVGIGAGGLGYGGMLVEGRWHRIVFVVDNNILTLFIDGKKISTAPSAQPDRWVLRNVCYFFADNDGEEGPIDIAELRYWNTALNDRFVRRLGSVSTQTSLQAIRQDPTSSLPQTDFIYDLAGRIIGMSKDKLRNGIYIINGNEFLVK